MDNEKDTKKKGKTGLIIALVLFLAVAAAFGFFLFRFIQKMNADRAAWQASYEERVTPVPTSKVTPEPTPEPTEAPTPEPTKAPETPTPTPEPVKEPLQLVDPSIFVSDFAYMIRVSDGEVSSDKNGNERMYPASMTKIMTAILAIEKVGNLETKITVYPEDIDPAYEAGASLAGFEPYEVVSVKDLLYGCLLPSGAEACEALATAAAPTTADFINLMNEKAAEIGLTGTHFVNVTGLHDPEHYTTARDVAVLMQYALKNKDFRTIICADSWVCAPTEQHPEGLTLYSTMFNQLPMTEFDNGAKILGGKTGTEDEAGRCLASFASYGEEEYILVTGHAPMEEFGNIDDACKAYMALGTYTLDDRIAAEEAEKKAAEEAAELAEKQAAVTEEMVTQYQPVTGEPAEGAAETGEGAEAEGEAVPSAEGEAAPTAEDAAEGTEPAEEQGATP